MDNEKNNTSIEERVAEFEKDMKPEVISLSKACRDVCGIADDLTDDELTAINASIISLNFVLKLSKMLREVMKNDGGE